MNSDIIYIIYNNNKSPHKEESIPIHPLHSANRLLNMLNILTF